MSLITPHLWFDTQAVEAAGFYCSVMPDARITHRSVLRSNDGQRIARVSRAFLKMKKFDMAALEAAGRG